MADFRTGAVRIARDNEADLLPVVISGSFDISPPGSPLIYPGRVRVRILPPVPSANIEPGDIRKVTDELRNDMGTVYDELSVRR